MSFRLSSPSASSPRSVRFSPFPPLSSNESIWAPKASSASKPPTWPDSTIPWSSLQSSETLKGPGRLNHKTDEKREESGAENLSAHPFYLEKPSQSAFAAGGGRNRVGAIGEGRLGDSVRSDQDSISSSSDTPSLTPDYQRRSRITGLALDLSALNISNTSSSSRYNEIRSPPSFSTPSDSPSTPPDSARFPYSRLLESKGSPQFRGVRLGSNDSNASHLSPTNPLTPLDVKEYHLLSHHNLLSPRSQNDLEYSNRRYDNILHSLGGDSPDDFRPNGTVAGTTNTSQIGMPPIQGPTEGIHTSWMQARESPPQMSLPLGPDSRPLLQPSPHPSLYAPLSPPHQSYLERPSLPLAYFRKVSHPELAGQVPPAFTPSTLAQSPTPSIPFSYNDISFSQHSPTLPYPPTYNPYQILGAPIASQTPAPAVVEPQPMHHPVAHPVQIDSSEPINFLHMLSPSASPPYDLFVSRIINQSDQQASVFLQQKIKVGNAEARMKIVDAISSRGYEMMTHRFGNWAVQRCLESPCAREDRIKLAEVMKGHVVDLATNCYGTHVIQKALDCDDDIKLLVLTELLLGDPYSTLMNKHAAHVWSRIMELTWADPVPPIFQCVNASLKGRWVDLACHETGSLVVQHAFENLEESDTRDLVNEVLQGFDRIIRDAWGSWVVQHLLEHGIDQDKTRAVALLLNSLHQYGTDAQAIKSIEKALKCGGPEVFEQFVSRLCEPGFSKRRAMLVDLALNGTGSQLIAQVLPNVNKEQGTRMYDAIKKHVVTLKGSKSGSRVTWLFDKMRAYYGY